MKILVFILSYLLAIVIGIVVGMLIDKDNTYKVTIRKIKQRGEGNILRSALDVNLTPKNDRRQRNKAKREARKAARKD